MAPKRRTTAPRAAATAASRQQATLSFNGKQSQVTKPGAAPQDPKLAQKEAALQDAATAVPPTDTIEAPSTQTTSDLTTPVPEPSTLDAPKSDDEEDHDDDAAAPDPLDPAHAGVTTEAVLGGRAETSTAGAVGGGDGSGWVADEEARARKIPETQIKRYWRAKEQARLAPRVHQEDLNVHEKILREWDVSNQFGPCIGIARLKRWKRANMLGLQPPIEVLAVLLKEIDAGNTKSQRAYVDELMTSRNVEP